MSTEQSEGGDQSTNAASPETENPAGMAQVLIPVKQDQNSTTSSKVTATVSTSRYEKFQEILHKSLTESHKSVDALHLIQECYGVDTEFFAATQEEGNKLLVGLLDRALEQIDDAMKEHIQHQCLIHEHVELKLDHFDGAIEKINADETMAREHEELDRKSAQDAVRNSRIGMGMGTGKGLSMEDVMTYRAFLLKKEARDILLAKVKAEHEAAGVLQEKLDSTIDAYKSTVSVMADQGKDLGQTANGCSFNGVS